MWERFKIYWLVGVNAYNIFGLPFEPIPGGRHEKGSEKVPKVGSDQYLGSDRNSD